MAQDFEDAGLIEDFAVLLGREESGDQSIDADVLVAPFAGQVAGQVVDCGLRHRVGEDAREWVEAGDGADIDDGGRLGFADEVFAEDLTGAEYRAHVGVENALEFVFGDIEEGGGGIGASAIDQDVDLTGFPEGLLEQVLQRFTGSDVNRDKVALAAVGFDFLEAGFGFFGDASTQNNLGAGAGQADGDGPAKFTGAADDYGGLPGQIEEFLEVGRAWHASSVGWKLPLCQKELPERPSTLITGCTQQFQLLIRVGLSDHNILVNVPSSHPCSVFYLRFFVTLLLCLHWPVAIAQQSSVTDAKQLSGEEREILEAAMAKPVSGDPVQIYGWREHVVIKGAPESVIAKLDTGARTSSIHVEKDELFERDGRKWVRFIFTDPTREKSFRVKIEAPLVRIVDIKEPGAKSVPREVVKLGIKIGDRQLTGEFTLNNRNNMLAPVLIGRTLLQELGLVDPGRTHLAEKKIMSSR